jgi:hypothetical protein
MKEILSNVDEVREILISDSPHKRNWRHRSS